MKKYSCNTKKCILHSLKDFIFFTLSYAIHSLSLYHHEKLLMPKSTRLMYAAFAVKSRIFQLFLEENQMMIEIIKLLRSINAQYLFC